MRIVQVLPRGMHFGPRRATAIDLCARDFVGHSQYARSTTVLGAPVEEPFEGISFQPVEVRKGASQVAAACRFAQAARALSPDLVLVHQNVISGAIIGRALAPVPVLLHRHNLQKRGSAFTRLYQRWQFGQFARTIWVSDVARRSFLTSFPQFADSAVTVHSGLDLAAWSPARDREQVVLCVGRATPDKGLLEAAQALSATLANASGWRARFILSRLDRDDGYLERVRQALAPLGQRAEVQTDRRHSIVKRAYETAAIAIVPSIFSEPFGRTAIEAMAGGAALVCSRSGALPEVVGDAALSLEAVSPAAISAAVGSLMANDSLRADYAARGRRRAERCFQVQKQAQALDNLYATVLGVPQPSWSGVAPARAA
jgi:glycosyltransferase involved in cell wall biosynthesis